MAKKRILVNGVEYDSVQEAPSGAITLSSSKHPNVFVTSLEELSTQYGAKQAWAVKLALNR